MWKVSITRGNKVIANEFGVGQPSGTFIKEVRDAINDLTADFRDGKPQSLEITVESA